MKTDRVVFDPKTNRFYEADITLGSSNEEEFCLKDSVTGQPILLAKVSKSLFLTYFNTNIYLIFYFYNNYCFFFQTE
jgi:hypothetical protein